MFALGQEYIYVPDRVGGEAPNPGDFQGVVNAEMLLLDNPELSLFALETVGVDRVFPGLPLDEDAVNQAVLWVQNSTTVELITGSYVVKIAVQHVDPEIAAELTNAITAAFLERRRALYTTRETSRLQTRLEAAIFQAANTNNEVAELLDGLAPQFITFDLERSSEDLANLEGLLRQSRTTLAALEVRRDLYASRLGMEDRVLLTESEIKEEQARIDYIERSMLENREKVENLSALIPILRPLTALQQQQSEQIADLQMRLRDNLALSGANIEGNVRVIERAVPPLRPRSASRKVQLAIVAIVSLLAGISVAGFSTLLSGGKPETSGSGNPARSQPIFGHLRAQNSKRKPKVRAST
ncbi:Capsular polysaccharide biosynthesis protein [Ruegeria atlantica]|uniref:Capsular polysaccharide biosynthesis protein n=1 Tax=Ruegeria atlantica TaxID=81569 RepID=A0A0P1E4H6_9RHOB|nr:Capsular polysaccharide biosynthesis protein [Ruegeria atlantica]